MSQPVVECYYADLQGRVPTMPIRAGIDAVTETVKVAVRLIDVNKDSIARSRVLAGYAPGSDPTQFQAQNAIENINEFRTRAAKQHVPEVPQQAMAAGHRLFGLFNRKPAAAPSTAQGNQSNPSHSNPFNRSSGGSGHK